MTTDLSQAYRAFPGTERCTYMDVSARGLVPRFVRDALVAHLDERIDLMCRLASVEGPDAITFVTRLDHADPRVDSLTGVFGGALWHEREAYEMFGIDFVGHPQLVKLYLPDAFEGNPLLKSYPLLSRDVKPWPGTVDVEGMPSTDNVEAGTSGDAAGSDDGGDAS